MAYSKEIQGVLRRKGIREGDRIVVGDYEGLLMPSPDITGSPDHIVLKLDNGYNVGIKYEKGLRIERSKKSEPKVVEEEYEREVEEHHVKKLEEREDYPKIAIISVGGTIASKVDYRTGAVSAAMTAKDLVAQVPELLDIAHIEVETLFEVMSEDMGPKHWIKLAKEVGKQLDKSDGVVITHGTDTMHYTSAALSFMLRGLNKPVVLTGAQRSSDRGSSDASINLICSVHSARSDVAEVAICMHGEPDDSFCLLNRGTKVRKMHATMRNAFRPVNDYPIAKVWPDGKMEFIKEDYHKRGKGNLKVDAKFEEKVALLKAYPGSKPELVDWLVKQGIKGIVVEGTGLGHVPTKAKNSWIPSIKSAVDSGVTVVVATQTLYGRVNPNVYSNLRVLYYEAGAIPALDMLPETAYVKLGWVLAHTKVLKRVREMMSTNYAGEFNERLQPDMFLY